MNHASEITIDVSDCVVKFIDEWSRYDKMGNWAFTTSEIMEMGISSPPEQLFYAAYQSFALNDNFPVLQPQYPIGNYFTDFALILVDYFVNQHTPSYSLEVLKHLNKYAINIAVEIDGFEWHDKTPQQAENDRCRERFIQSRGYRVIRFSAREVLRDPTICIGEVIRATNEELKRVSSHIAVLAI